MPCNNGQKAKRTRKGNSKESKEASKETASRKLRSRSSEKQEAMDVQKKCEPDEDHEPPPSECLEVDLVLNKNDDHSTGQTKEENNETITELVMDKQAHDEAGGPASFNHSTNGATSSNIDRNVCTSNMTQSFQDISGVVSLNNNSEKINSSLLESPMINEGNSSTCETMDEKVSVNSSLAKSPMINEDNSHTGETMDGKDCVNSSLVKSPLIVEGNSSTCKTMDGKDCVNSSDKYDEHKQSVNCLQLEPALTSNYEHFKEDSVYEMMDVRISDCSMNSGTQSQMCAVGNPSGTKAGQDVDDCEVSSKDTNNVNTDSDTNSHHPNTSLSTDITSSKMEVCKIRFDNSSLQTNSIIGNFSQFTTIDLDRSMPTNLCDSLDKDAISAQQSSKSLKRTLHSPLSNSQVKKFKSPCAKNIPEVESSSTNCSTQDMSWELSTQAEIISGIQNQDGCKSELKLSKGPVQTIIGSKHLQLSIADVTNHASYGTEYEGVLSHRPVVVEAVEELTGDKGKYSAKDQIVNEEAVSQRQLIIKTDENHSAEKIYPVGNNKEDDNSVGEGHFTIEATKEKVLEETSPSTTKHNYTKLMNAVVNAPHVSLLHAPVNREANVTKTTEASEETFNQLISNTSTYSSRNGEQQQQHYQEKSPDETKDHEELGAYSGCQVLDVKHASLRMAMIVSSNSGDAGGLFKPLSTFNTSIDTGEKQCPDLMKSSTEKGDVEDYIFTMKQAAIHNKNAGTFNTSDREVMNKAANENEILEIVVLDSNVKDTHNLSTCTPQTASLQELNSHQFKLLPELATQDMPQSLLRPENGCSYNAMTTQPNSCQTSNGDLPYSSNVDIANSPSTNKHVYSTLNMDTKEDPLVHGDHLQSTMTAQLPDQIVPNVTPLNKASSEDTSGPQILRIDNETNSPTSMSEQQEQESKQNVYSQSNMNLSDVRTQTCISEASLLTDNKTPFLMNKPTYHLNTDDSQSRQISFLAKERTSDNSQLTFDNLDHHSVANFLRISSKSSLDSQEKSDTILSHSDIEGVSITQSSYSNQQESYRDKPSQSIKDYQGASNLQYNSPSDQQQVTRKQPVTTLYETSNNLMQYNSPSDQQKVSKQQPVTSFCDTSNNNILQYNSPSDQPKACTENPTSISTDLAETKNDTILDSAMDLSDSQICQLTTEDYAHSFNSTPPEDIDATEHLDKFKHNFDSAQTKAAKDIDKRKGEGKKLVDEIMSNLVSLNKQLLRMKKEMETVRRVVQQQQHGKAGFSYTSSHMFGNGS